MDYTAVVKQIILDIYQSILNSKFSFYVFSIYNTPFVSQTFGHFITLKWNLPSSGLDKSTWSLRYIFTKERWQQTLQTTIRVFLALLICTVCPIHVRTFRAKMVLLRL